MFIVPGGLPLAPEQQGIFSRLCLCALLILQTVRPLKPRTVVCVSLCSPHPTNSETTETQNSGVRVSVVRPLQLRASDQSRQHVNSGQLADTAGTRQAFTPDVHLFIDWKEKTGQTSSDSQHSRR